MGHDAGRWAIPVASVDADLDVTVKLLPRLQFGDQFRDLHRCSASEIRNRLAEFSGLPDQFPGRTAAR
jgi:hypothetical protein